MLPLKFNVVKSTKSSEPTAAYFQKIEQNAAAVPNSIDITETQVWFLGEYLDAVDGGCMTMNKSLYRQCTNALSNFLANASDTAFVLSFVNKCWAAKTLYELLQHCPTSQVMQQQTA